MIIDVNGLPFPFLLESVNITSSKRKKSRLVNIPK